MKHIKLVIIFLFTVNCINAQTTVYSENFEGGVIPSNWLIENVVGSVNWDYINGGASSKPAAAYQGSYNARFYHASYDGNKTKLIMPSLNLDTVVNPKLVFWHSQNNFGLDQDELKIYYKIGSSGAWNLISSYTSAVTSWTERTIVLPNPDTAYYIAFEGMADYGYGVCIDDVKIIEPPPIPKYIASMSFSQPSTEVVLKGSVNNILLRIDIEVEGDADSLIFKSIELTSLNTNDNDLVNYGVRMYYTSDMVFSTNELLDSASFIFGKSIYTSIDYDLFSGMNYIWITYDVSDSAISDNILDAKIEANSILIGSSLYGPVEESPPGSRIIIQTIFQDDFEFDLGWQLSGEFERNTPSAKGGSIGNKDPLNSYSGDTVLGVDLTGLGIHGGDYESDMSDRECYAISPSINCYYYRNVSLRFFRWLNVDLWDNAYVDISTDDSTWVQIWTNSGLIQDDSWGFNVIDISSYADYKSSVRIRYSLGTTDNTDNFSGWNIDDVFFTGDFISKQVGVTEMITPSTGCGHSNSELVSVRIANYGGAASPSEIPVFYSFDGGTTIIYDTLYCEIPVNEDTIFTFTVPVDLSLSGKYQIIIATTLSDDEDVSDDTLSIELTASPTYKIPYVEEFENNDGLWMTGGNNISWEYGTPSATLINSAGSGVNSWSTNLNGSYSVNEASYIESPCIDIYGLSSPFVDFKIAYSTEENTDGVAMQYSLDEGNTWSLLGDYNDSLNWYNGNSITSLNSFGISNGWHNGDGTWNTSKYALPDTIMNAANVKFRFVFASNSIIINEGVAIDDFRVYEFPYDIGIAKYNAPYSACMLSSNELISFTYFNSGTDTIPSGDTLAFSLLNDSLIIIDTVVLTALLLPSDSLIHTFSEVVDMSEVAIWNYNISVNYNKDVNIHNDSISESVNVYGFPDPELGNSFSTINVDTVSLYPGLFNEYLWHDNSVNDTFCVSSNASSLYYVVVTDTNNCSASDSIFITTTNIYIDSVINPRSACMLSSSETISIKIENSSGDTISIGDTLYFGYVINADSCDNVYVLTENLLPDSSFVYGFTCLLPMNFIRDYNVSVFIKNKKDIYSIDDTVTFIAQVYGYPTPNLGNTIYTKMPDTISLNSGEYNSYLWQDNSVNNTFQITDMNSSWYHIMVTDSNNCSSSDSIEIISTDLSVLGITSPKSKCEFSNAEIVSAKIRNTSYDTIFAGDSIIIGLNVNEEFLFEENFVLTNNLLPDSILDFIFSATVDMDSLSLYQLELYINYYRDIDTSNNNYLKIITEFNYPNINLTDTICTTKPDTVIISPDQYSDYLWQDGSRNNTYNVTNLFSNNYYLTVTDSNGCSASDSLIIISTDISVSQILNPISSCSLNSSENIKIALKNESYDTLMPGTNIQIWYRYNNGSINQESIWLSDSLYPDSLLNHTFLSSITIIDTSSFVLVVGLDYKKDIWNNNNELTNNIKIFGFPNLNLGENIYSLQADTITLFSGSYSSYLWQDSTISDSFNIQSNNSDIYSVMVNDTNGCISSDTVIIYAEDLGLLSVISPSTSCELSDSETVILKIINSGNDIFYPGKSFILSLIINSGIPIIDTVILADSLKVGDTLDYAFIEKQNFKAIGTYSLNIQLININDVLSNNTISSSMYVYGNPNPELGESIITIKPDTVILYPGLYQEYLWQDSSVNSQFNVSQLATNWYSVSVTDENNCSASDSIQVVIASDIGVYGLKSPINACALSDSEIVSVQIYNYSNDEILIGDTIIIGKIMYDKLIDKDTIILEKSLKPDSSIIYVFSTSHDMTVEGDYVFKIFTFSNSDADPSNDTVYFTVKNYGYPNPDFGLQKETKQADTLKLFSGDFYSYLWQDGSVNDTFSVSKLNSSWYYVTVSTQFGCKAEDSVYVNANDLSLVEMLSPYDGCYNELTNSISFKINNAGNDTIPVGDTISIYYSLDSVLVETEKIIIDSVLKPNDDLILISEFNSNLKAVGNHKILAGIIFNNDIIKWNDSRVFNYTVYGNPVIELGNDIYTKQPDTVILSPGNYSTYIWQDSANTPSYSVNSPGLYSVSVTDVYGCVDRDSIEIIWFTTDIGIELFNSPIDKCVMSNAEEISVRITNFSPDTIYYGEKFIIGGILNDELFYLDTIQVVKEIYQKEYLDYIIPKSVDMSIIGSYKLSAFTSYYLDTHISNDTAKINISHYGNPQIDISDKDTIFTSNIDTIRLSPGSDFILWLWNDGSSLTTIIPNVSGLYSVLVLDSNGCSARDSVYIISTESIQEIIGNETFKIYPNPFNDELKINLQCEKSNIIIELFDQAGIRKKHYKYNDIRFLNKKIDMTIFPAGLYYMKIITSKNTVIKKIIKVK